MSVLPLTTTNCPSNLNALRYQKYSFHKSTFGNYHRELTQNNHPTTFGLTFTQAVKLLSGLLSKHKLRMVYGGNIVTEDAKLLPASVLIQGNKIHSVWPIVPGYFQYFAHKIEWIDARGKILTPGLIDQHTHGAYGTNFNQTESKNIETLLKKLPEHGVTNILSTLLTDTPDAMNAAIEKLKPFIQSHLENATQILGIHLEGPYLNPNHKGCHDTALLKKPPDSYEQIFTPNTLPAIKLVTMAPELDKDKVLTNYLLANNIRISAGHSGIGYHEMRYASQQGVTGVTHLFNSMPSIHHRNPGLPGAALTLPHVWPEIIADGYHVSIPVLQIAAKAKPNNLILVTDASPLAGLKEGSHYRHGNQLFQLKDNQVQTPQGRLAGSSLFMDEAIRNAVNWQVADFPTAINMASKHSADFLGLKHHGRIQPNAFANLLLWRPDDLAIEQTIIDGHTVYKRP